MQATEPAGHSQTPLVQAAPAGHWLPQAPQFRGSVWRWTQTPLQLSGVGAAQALHWPLTHSAPTAQSLPQRPQFCGSAERSKQPTPQSTRFGAQVHCPMLHVPPGPQSTPHAPQLAVSVAGSMQASPHTIVAGSLQAHAPFVQVAPVAHGVLQAPQWA